MDQDLEQASLEAALDALDSMAATADPRIDYFDSLVGEGIERRHPSGTSRRPC